MRVKDDVTFDGASAITLRAIAIADEVHFEIFGEPVTITEVVAPRQNVSLHPHGLAFDFRDSGHIPKMREVFMRRLQARLDAAFGPGWQLLHHGPVPHFHAEWDPA